MTEKKVTKKVTPKKPELNADVVAIVTAILLTKMTNTQAAMENAKMIVESVNELVGN